MKSFVFESLPGRVIFGLGSIGLAPAEVERLGRARVLLIYDPSSAVVAKQLAARLGGRVVGEFTDIRQHTPIETVLAARKAATDTRADCVITIGGGSTTGFGKAIALESGIDTIAIPTTYAGSEMTPIYGITADRHKRTGRDIRVLPKAVIYDPELTTSLPPAATGASGMNAMAHCVEALYAQGENPITSLIAEEGLRALARGIPASVREPTDLAARSDALYGAYLAGAALAVVGMAVHHRICHVLGGTFGLPHAETNAAVLPHTVRFNQDAAPRAMERVARALAVDEPASGLFDFAAAVSAPLSLESLGMRHEDLDETARMAAEPPLWNPRPVEVAPIRELLEDAFWGRRPSSREPASVGAVTGSGPARIKRA
jgi:alcohol dehydrogenase class IV